MKIWGSHYPAEFIISIWGQLPGDLSSCLGKEVPRSGYIGELYVLQQKYPVP